MQAARPPCPSSPPSAASSAVGPRAHAIIKLGGAAVTNKNEYESLKPAVLQHTAACIRRLYLQRISHTSTSDTISDSRAGICIVHGAGSFGHFDAHQYQVAQGGNDHRSALEGFAKTRRSVTKLNQLVVSALVEAGVPAVGLSPCGAWTTSNRQLLDSTAGVAAVAALLQAGFVPVLHGDCVLDQQLGMTILSGDTIMRRLAEVFQPQYCVFLTNVAGLFTRPPEQPGAELVRQVRVRAPSGSWYIPAAEGGAEAAAGGTEAAAAAGACQPAVQFTSAEHDTTGGIATKVAEAAGVVLAGIPVVIAQAGTLSGGAAVLFGEKAFKQQQAVGSLSSGASGCSNSQAADEVLLVQQLLQQLDLMMQQSIAGNSGGSGDRQQQHSLFISEGDSSTSSSSSSSSPFDDSSADSRSDALSLPAQLQATVLLLAE